MTVVGLVVATVGYVRIGQWPLDLASAGLRMDIDLIVAGAGLGVVIAPRLRRRARDHARRAARGGLGRGGRRPDDGHAARRGRAVRVGLLPVPVAHRRVGHSLPFGVERAEFARRLAEYEQKVLAALHTEYTEIFLLTAALCALAVLVALLMPRTARQG